MSMNFTRRDFLKCAGITVLAVGAGSLLTGCDGGGSGGGTAGVGTPVTINGITVTVTGYETKEVKAGIGDVTIGDTSKKFLFPEVTVKNETGDILRIGGASNFTLKVDGQELSYLSTATASAAAFLYGHELLDQKTGYSIPDKAQCSGALAYMVPSNWQKAELRFIPDLSKPNEYRTIIITNNK